MPVKIMVRTQRSSPHKTQIKKKEKKKKGFNHQKLFFKYYYFN